MLRNDTLASRILDTLLGALVFIIVVASATYYLQSSLILVKHYDAYTHWAAVLIGVPLAAGLIMRQLRLYHPLVSAVLGAVATAALLYPFYQVFWAEPPTITDLSIYVAVVLGIGFIATQPLRTTFMIAFRLGRFAVPKIGMGDKGGKTSVTKGKSAGKGAAKAKATTAKTATAKTASAKATTARSQMTKTQRLQLSDNGNVIAMLELMVGVTSLVLSIVSIFFLGHD